MIDGKRVLVTGGSGFIGSNLVARLVRRGCRIRSTYRHPIAIAEREPVEWVQADLTREEDCERVVEGVDILFHCAANTSGANVIVNRPLVHVTPNVVMNTQLLDAAHSAGVERFAYRQRWREQRERSTRSAPLAGPSWRHSCAGRRPPRPSVELTHDACRAPSKFAHSTRTGRVVRARPRDGLGVDVGGCDDGAEDTHTHARVPMADVGDAPAGTSAPAGDRRRNFIMLGARSRRVCGPGKRDGHGARL